GWAGVRGGAPVAVVGRCALSFVQDCSVQRDDVPAHPGQTAIGLPSRHCRIEEPMLKFPFFVSCRIPPFLEILTIKGASGMPAGKISEVSITVSEYPARSIKT